MMAKVHSIVGLITNSSSETFAMYRDKIEEILFEHLGAVLGEGVNPRDVFEIIIEPSDEVREAQAWRFYEGLEPDLYDELLDGCSESYIPDNPEKWPQKFQDMFNESVQEGVSMTVSWEYDPDGRGRNEGAVFIKRRDTGEIDTKLSAAAFSILNIQKNGSTDF